MAKQNINIQNRKAGFEFEILEKFTAGMVLTGTEIKSVRQGKVVMSDAYCYYKNGRPVVKNLHISEYDHGSYFNHEPKRERELLLRKREIGKIGSKLKEKGLTLIPLRLFLNERGLAKLEIGLARGKKLYDKRESIKDREISRDMRRRED